MIQEHVFERGRTQIMYLFLLLSLASCCGGVLEILDLLVKIFIFFLKPESLLQQAE
jgi:hypothetical protein